MAQRSLKYRAFRSQRRFGVELEVGYEIKKKAIQTLLSKESNHQVKVSKYELSKDNNYWHVKDDSTCGKQGRSGPKGIEVCSYIGRGVSDILHVANMAAKLEELGCRVNENCGLHIHAEVLDLTPSQLASVIAHWIKLEFVISLALPSRRCGNAYCQYTFDPYEESAMFASRVWRTGQYSPERFLALVLPEDHRLVGNMERRVNLNLVNVARSLYWNNPQRCTLELRWPEGTLDAKDIRCWVRLFLNFIEFTKNRGMPVNLYPSNLEESLECLGFNHATGLFVLLSSGLFETKTWFLERILQQCQDNQSPHYQTVFAKTVAADARNILNKMWKPVRQYA